MSITLLGNEAGTEPMLLLSSDSYASEEASSDATEESNDAKQSKIEREQKEDNEHKKALDSEGKRTRKKLQNERDAVLREKAEDEERSLERKHEIEKPGSSKGKKGKFLFLITVLFIYQLCNYECVIRRKAQWLELVRHHI